MVFTFFCVKQKTAYEMRISDWSSDVCSADLLSVSRGVHAEAASRHGGQKRALKWSAAAFSGRKMAGEPVGSPGTIRSASFVFCPEVVPVLKALLDGKLAIGNTAGPDVVHDVRLVERSEEHTSELQSLMRLSYADFFLKQKKKTVEDKLTTRELKNKSERNK